MNMEVSKELAQAVNDYCLNARKGYPRVKDEIDQLIYDAFIAGAKWQGKQLVFYPQKDGKSLLPIAEQLYAYVKERLDEDKKGNSQWKPSEEQMEALRVFVRSGERELTVGQDGLIHKLYVELTELCDK